MNLTEDKVSILDTLDEHIPQDAWYKDVAVIGLGFVGLPLALSFSLRGCNVIGVDINERLVEEINNGITAHKESFYDIPITDILKREIKRKHFYATANISDVLDDCHNFIITVGIPIVNGEHEMEYLESACTELGKGLRQGDLVIVRSTVVPGTTEEIVKPLLESASGLKAGDDFHLAYSSERIAEGRAFQEFADMPILVAGVDEISTNKAKELLGIVCKAEVIPASSIKVVETAKVFENVQRDVNIAMIQEFARFTEALGIDIFEVVNLANTHKRVKLLAPGPGVGGYCLPNAYYYLKPKAEQMGISLSLLELARKENDTVPQVIVDMLERALADNGKRLSGSDIAVLGLAMKDYSNDARISPPLEIVNILLQKQANVKAFDPAVDGDYPYKVDDINECISDADAVVILAKQHEIDSNINKVLSAVPEGTVVLDTRDIRLFAEPDLLSRVRYVCI